MINNNKEGKINNNINNLNKQPNIEPSNIESSNKPFGQKLPTKKIIVVIGVLMVVFLVILVLVKIARKPEIGPSPSPIESQMKELSEIGQDFSGQAKNLESTSEELGDLSEELEKVDQEMEEQ